jgi:hypothetical protein
MAQAGLDPVAGYTPSHEAAQRGTALARDYPLVLITPAEHYFLNSIFANVPRQQRKDDAAQAESALSGLLFDESALDRVRVLGRSQSFEGFDLGSIHAFDRRDAGADGPAIHDNRAGAALSQAAAELGPTQLEVVAENVKKRRRRIHIQGVGATVDRQGNRAQAPAAELTRIRESIMDPASCKTPLSPGGSSSPAPQPSFSSRAD